MMLIKISYENWINDQYERGNLGHPKKSTKIFDTHFVLKLEKQANIMRASSWMIKNKAILEVIIVLAEDWNMITTFQMTKF